MCNELVPNAPIVAFIAAPRQRQRRQVLSHLLLIDRLFIAFNCLSHCYNFIVIVITVIIIIIILLAF